MALNPKIRDWRDRRVWIVGGSTGIGAAIKRFLLNRTAETAATAQFNTDYGDGAWVINIGSLAGRNTFAGASPGCSVISPSPVLKASMPPVMGSRARLCLSGGMNTCRK